MIFIRTFLFRKLAEDKFFNFPQSNYPSKKNNGTEGRGAPF